MTKSAKASLPRMSPTMQAVFDRVAREDAHLGDAMKLPWAQAQANFHVTASRWYKGDPAKSRLERFAVPCPEHEMQAIRVSQKSGGRKGTLLFLHGGGWVFGSPDSHLGAAARLSELTGLTVVSVDYRLAPAHPFPAGLNDANWVWRWLKAGQKPMGLSGPWLVAGDSAGANLALSLMLDLRDAGEALPDAALLFYGVYSPDHSTVSHRQLGSGAFGLSSEKMDWFWGHYMDAARHPREHPRAAPLLADLHGLPPLYLNAAGLDCLRDDSLAMVARLQQAGVPHQFDLVPGVNHGFMQMSRELPEAMAAYQTAAAWVKKTLPA
jgi:acetyl esterase/lipase